MSNIGHFRQKCCGKLKYGSPPTESFPFNAIHTKELPYIALTVQEIV